MCINKLMSQGKIIDQDYLARGKELDLSIVNAELDLI